MKTSDEFRKVVVRLSRPLGNFLREQIAFLEKAGVENASSEILVDSVRLFCNMVHLSRNDIALKVEGSRPKGDTFSVTDELEEVTGSPRPEVYVVQIPDLLDEEFEYLLKNTPCADEEEVIIASLCCFRWILGFIVHRENVFVRYDEAGETHCDVYRVPILEIYKPIVFH